MGYDSNDQSFAAPADPMQLWFMFKYFFGCQRSHVNLVIIKELCKKMFKMTKVLVQKKCMFRTSNSANSYSAINNAINSGSPTSFLCHLLLILETLHFHLFVPSVRFLLRKNMAKTDKCVPNKGGSSTGSSKGTSKGRKGVHANPFILFYLDNVKRCGGNYYRVAQRSGEKWRAMSQADKDKWYSIYYSKYGNTNSRAYKRWKKRQGGGGGCC